LIGFGIAVVAAWLAAEQAWLAAGILVAVGALFDLFDGALARATGTASKFGAFLDSTFDRAGEAVVYVGIACGCYVGGFPATGLIAMAAMATAFMVSYVRAKSESLGFTPGTGMANVGLAPREVRTVFVVIGLVAAGLAGGLGAPMFVNSTGLLAIGGSMSAITLLATLTTIQRIFHVYREAKKQEHQ
jgi:CDP-diacylglycerol--glycerol-3-phosphate 3-phosphatidyltransferase